MRHTLEQEIKLEADNGFELPELPGTALAPATLVSTYYDTSDLRLAAAGITVRRRAQRGGPVWQLKLPRDGAYGESRDELEWSGSSTDPPPEVAGLLVAHTRGARLAPAATLRTERTGIRVRGIEADVANVVVDDVSILDGDRVARRFREIEVERLRDAPGVLEQMRSVLVAAGARAGETRPKLFQALDIREPAAEPAPGRHDPTCAHVRARIARQRDALIAHDPGTRIGRDPEELHQMRVAVRRLRALLRCTRTLQTGGWAEPLADDLRWLGRALGPVRDTDVLLERFRGRAGDLSPGLQTPFVHSLAPIVEIREAARREMFGALESSRYLTLLARLDAAATGATVDENGPSLQQLARKEYRRLRKRVGQLDANASDDELHATRILGKRARYAAEFAAPTMSRNARKFIAKAKRFQDVLGEHQDSCIAEVELFRIAAAARDTDAAFAAGVVLERERTSRQDARAGFPASWRVLHRAGKELWS